MLVPGWDVNKDRAWHGHIAVMRRCGGRLFRGGLVRAAKDAISRCDYRAAWWPRRASDNAPFATLLATFQAAHSATVYLLLRRRVAWRPARCWCLRSCAFLQGCDRCACRPQESAWPGGCGGEVKDPAG